MEKKGISQLDVRIVISATICVLTATVLNMFDLKFTYGEGSLEIIQKMTAAIACLLCCQDDTKISWKSGINRMIITAIGGVIAIVVTLLDALFQNQIVFVFMIAIGLLLTLLFCKMAGVPYINARIGGVTFILVACTMAGNARILYAIFRLVSTLYGVLITMLVTWVFQKVCKNNE